MRNPLNEKKPLNDKNIVSPKGELNNDDDIAAQRYDDLEIATLNKNGAFGREHIVRFNKFILFNNFSTSKNTKC